MLRPILRTEDAIQNPFFIAPKSIHMTTRYIGHPDAPSFTYRESKRFKIRPESLAYSIMDDLICRIHIYDDMAEDELRRGLL